MDGSFAENAVFHQGRREGMKVAIGLQERGIALSKSMAQAFNYS